MFYDNFEIFQECFAIFYQVLRMQYTHSDYYLFRFWEMKLQSNIKQAESPSSTVQRRSVVLCLIYRSPQQSATIPKIPIACLGGDVTTGSYKRVSSYLYTYYSSCISMTNGTILCSSSGFTLILKPPVQSATRSVIICGAIMQIFRLHDKNYQDDSYCTQFERLPLDRRQG